MVFFLSSFLLPGLWASLIADQWYYARSDGRKDSRRRSRPAQEDGGGGPAAPAPGGGRPLPRTSRPAAATAAAAAGRGSQLHNLLQRRIHRGREEKGQTFGTAVKNYWSLFKKKSVLREYSGKMQFLWKGMNYFFSFLFPFPLLPPCKMSNYKSKWAILEEGKEEFLRYFEGKPWNFRGRGGCQETRQNFKAIFFPPAQ